jgi:hypothetical protein
MALPHKNASSTYLLIDIEHCPMQAGEGIVGGTPHPPLVGNIAPDFSAQAVYDQEFIDITLSQYRG